MTNIGTFILLLVCVAIGYVVEPIFFSESNRSKKQVVDTEPSTDPVAPTPAPVTPEINMDLSKVTPEDFPEKVTLKKPITIADSSSGISMTLKQGVKVKPVRIEDGQLVITPVGLPLESKIAVDDTDFKSLALPKMLERLQNAVAKNDPMPPAEPAAPAEPAPPAPEPTPAPPAEPEVAKSLDADAIVALMKKSVEGGKVTEFKANQVTEWKAGEEMEFDGDKYQTGHVTFKAETILGVQEHDAIALIEDGEIIKWMWAKTKLEMR